MKKKARQSNLVRPGEEAESALWRNVILQAIADATLRLPSYESEHRRQMELIRGQARRWIKFQSEDFHRVCELAGLDAGRVRAFAMAQIRKAIEEGHARTVRENFLNGPSRGVVAEIAKELGDRPTPTAQKTENLEFSQNQDLP